MIYAQIHGFPFLLRVHFNLTSVRIWPVFNSFNYTCIQVRRHEVLIGGRIHRHTNFQNSIQNKYFQNLVSPDFQIRFWLLDFENIGKYKNRTFQEKILKYPKLWGVDPRGFQKCKGRDPREPASCLYLFCLFYIIFKSVFYGSVCRTYEGQYLCYCSIYF